MSAAAATAATSAAVRPPAATTSATGSGRIQGDDVVTGIDEVEAHGQTHVAEADETDGFRGSCFRHGRS